MNVGKGEDHFVARFFKELLYFKFYMLIICKVKVNIVSVCHMRFLAVTVAFFLFSSEDSSGDILLRTDELLTGIELSRMGML